MSPVQKRPTVAEFMTPNPFTLEPEESLMQALETMRLRSVRRIPIVLAGMLVGLLVEGDLKRAEPSTLSESQEDFTRVMEGTTIARIMIQNPVTVTAATPLLEAAHTLHSTKYGSLPVVEEGRLVGIITDNDMLRALIEILGRED
ncbi:MAG TPA: CBS domain-containing protein [Vicinamibacteria bacterium]|jgi:acetoin utilization protein AcuB|nr:CBS domain-containing protein [Vicinamibacteria bacterium]